MRLSIAKEEIYDKKSFIKNYGVRKPRGFCLLLYILMRSLHGGFLYCLSDLRGGGSDGAERQEAEADRTEDVGGESGRTAVKYKRTKAREEGSTLPFLAGR